MGLERTKFLKYISLLFIPIILSACGADVSENTFYLKNGETYLYAKNQSYNLGILSGKAESTGKYSYYLTENGNLCAFHGKKSAVIEEGVEHFGTANQYVFYIKNGKLYSAKGPHRKVISENAENFDISNGLCIYLNSGMWYFKNNEISDVKPFFVTEKYAYYSKDDVLYYKKYKTNSAVVSKNVYETAVIGNRVYFFTEKYSEKDFSEIFEFDCLEKDNTEKYSEHINHAEILNYFTAHKLPFKLYTLCEADADAKKKIDDDICDISSFYDVGEDTAVYKKLSSEKLKVSSLTNINDVYYAIDKKYEKADVYAVKDGETSKKANNCTADYFEMSDNLYYIDGGSLYAADKKIADDVENFETVPFGTVFADKNGAYLYSDGEISNLGRTAENIKYSKNELYFTDNGNLKNSHAALHKNVTDYKIRGTDLFYISDGTLYGNGTKIDTNVSEIY